MEGEQRSYLSMSYSDASPTALTRPSGVLRNVPLHDKCTIDDMFKMKEAFSQAYNNQMVPQDFREALRTLLNVEYDDEEYKLLFLKMNTSRTGLVDWDELVSHLILGYFGNDAENQRESLEPPIMGLPVIMRSQHRHPISRICFCPEVDKDRIKDPVQGVYLTASRDGMINWWSLDMKLLRTAYSTSPHLKVRTTWVTDMVCMPDVNIIVTSSTERDLRFYDCIAKTFTLKIIITSWDYMPKMLPELRLVDLGRMHSEWVRQVSYYESLHCVMSCATCSDSLLMCDIYGSKTYNMFRVDKGIQCFEFDEEAHVLVTGGPDCTVRVWNPFVPAKANVVFVGHHAAVTCIVLQNKGQTIYSLSRDRTIRVWDVQSQVCVQSYIDIPAVIGERSPISAVYNPATREFILACVKIAVVVLDEQLNPLHTDGNTHSRAVTRILYNPLFKLLITCGMDSIIINWNPVTGKRNVMIRDAHVRNIHGEQVPVEITAACFDPGYQLLLTGARNGELKVWNFNTGLCMRVMTIKHMCEVTDCFWVEGRILAIGWNRHVVEFADSGMAMYGKSWEMRHTDDVLASAVRPPLSLVTASYNSELVMWKLETGQPYRRFSCTEPTLRIKMVFNRRESIKQPPVAKIDMKAKNLFNSPPRKFNTTCRENVDSVAAVKKATERRLFTPSEPSRQQHMRHLAVHAMIFLQTRPHHAHVASIFLALENGQIQGWSDHSAGGYQGSFQAVHAAGDYVSCLATDVANEFLFTGNTRGYIKVWLMTNYLTNTTEHISMPRLRLMFPFLWRDRIEGRAKRSVRDQPKPLLLNSYRAHLRCINSIAYMDESKLFFSGSSDYSVRVWRLSGEYLQTLGSFLPWTLEVTRFPPDVKKVASSTTFKVWRGGYVSRYVPGQKEVDKLRDITELELKHKTFGKPPNDPLLGHYFSLPQRPDPIDRIKLDSSLSTIPLYTHLRMASTQPVRRPPTPELVRETRLRHGKIKKTHFGSSVTYQGPGQSQPRSSAQTHQALAAAGAPNNSSRTGGKRTSSR